MSVHPVTKREGGGWSVFENSNWPMRKQLKGRRESLFEFSGQLENELSLHLLIASAKGYR